MATHDLEKHLNLFRQALDGSRMPLALLLGAGCPQAIRVSGGGPLIPALDPLTEQVADAVEAQSSLCAPLKLVKAQCAAGTTSPPNIEDLLTRVRLLLELTRKVSVGDIPHATLKQLEDALCAEIMRRTEPSLPEEGGPYTQVAQWLAGIRRQIPVELFTLNYDLLQEQALERSRVPYFDGFVGAFEAFFDAGLVRMDGDSIPSAWVRFWKLHGSVNWWLRATATRSDVIRAKKVPDGTPCLIHPSHLKYDESGQMPYLAMMERLRDFLRQPNAVLVTCGFSFRDRHIAALIDDALSRNPHAIAFGLLYGPLSEYSETACKIAKRINNLNLFARDAGIIGCEEGVWMASPDTTMPGVEVTPPPPTGGQPSCKMLLGDFAHLGTFLGGLRVDTDPQRAT